jgi:PAS domain S-box-containing protein
VWSEIRRSAPIVIQAPMWRQPWAVLIGVALAAAVAYGLHRVAAQRRYARTLEREVETQIAALRLSEERVHRVRRAEMRRLDLTLGSIADGVVATDRLGRVILINPAATTITGWSAFDAVGRSVREVLPLQANDDAAREIDPMTIPERAKRHIDHDVTLSDPRGGDPRLIEITGAPMMETDGALKRRWLEPRGSKRSASWPEASPTTSTTS